MKHSSPMPENTCVFFVDLQKGPLGMIPFAEKNRLIANVLSFAKAMQALKVRMLVLRAAIPGEHGELVPELAEALADSPQVLHSRNNAWGTAELDQVFDSKTYCNLIFCGIATDVGVLLPAVSAKKSGFQVYVPFDCCATVSHKAQHAAELRLIQAGVTPSSWSALVGEIQADYTKPPGPELLGIIRGSMSSTPVEPSSEKEAPVYPFGLPKLRFSYDALEPYLDRQTLEVHHRRHHAAYISALNAILKDHPGLHRMTIEELLRNIETIPESIRQTVREQGGGHANHQFLWKILKPGPASEPTGSLLKALNQDFGSFEHFKREFTETAEKLVGSGWVFLVVDPRENGKLKIYAGKDHESVLYHGTPGLLICDMWEHAYYLKYQNRRAEYLSAFWELVDWKVVQHRFDGIQQGKKQL